MIIVIVQSCSERYLLEIKTLFSCVNEKCMQRVTVQKNRNRRNKNKTLLIPWGHCYWTAAVWQGLCVLSKDLTFSQEETGTATNYASETAHYKTGGTRILSSILLSVKASRVWVYHKSESSPSVCSVVQFVGWHHILYFLHQHGEFLLLPKSPTGLVLLALSFKQSLLLILGVCTPHYLCVIYTIQFCVRK